MPRLLNWPRGLSPQSQEPISGPSSIVGSGQSSLNGFHQTVSSPFGLWAWSLEFHPLQGRDFKEFRGWFAAMQNGANATRWTIDDPDRMSWRDTGVNINEPYNGNSPSVPWSNGLPWSNGVAWGGSRPWVPVTTALAKGATIARFDDVYWGRKIGVGEMFGFGPFHYGLYVAQEVKLDGTIRFWPPLRKSVVVGDHVTLNPTLVVRMVPNAGGGLKRDAEVAQGMQITFLEVEHEDVSRFYTE